MRLVYLPYLLVVCLITVFLMTCSLFYNHSKSSNNLFKTVNTLDLPDQLKQAQALTKYRKLPLSFEANKGQTDSEVKFFSRGKDYSLLLTETETILSLKNGKEDPATVRMKFAGANPKPKLEAIESRPSKINYFIGNDSKNWYSDLSEYNKVKYTSVYPGIDAIYYGNHQQLEYDLVVSPGADPQQIAIQLETNQSKALQLDTEGNLLIPTDKGNLSKHKPVIYQEINGTKQFIAGNYQLKGSNLVGFELGNYDHSKPLVIDPVFVYSTYFGSTDQDRGYGITVDKAGNVYMTGETLSITFPLKNAVQTKGGGTTLDMFVTKLNPTATDIVYSTYIVGNDIDRGFAITTDASGNAYVTGETYSTDFPTVNALQPKGGGPTNIDAFILKLNPDGNKILYSSYFGGSSVERAFSIAVNSSSNIFIAGETTSPDLPVKNAVQAKKGNIIDAYVARFTLDTNNMCTLDFSTYLGGNDLDQCHGMTIDSDSNIYLVGETVSSDFPVKNAMQPEGGGPDNIDIFVTKLTSTGSILFSTYIGPLDLDRGFGIAVDSARNIYITGATNSFNFPTVKPAQIGKAGALDAYLMKLDPTAKNIIFSTFLGGSKDDIAYNVVVDKDNNAYVYGDTQSLGDFPVQRALQSASTGGFFDTFVTKYNSDGQVVFSTYLGGNDVDHSGKMAVDSDGNVYVIGYTPSLDFLVANAINPNKNGDVDIFLAKISDPVINCPKVSFSPSTLPDALINTFYNQNIAIANATTSYTFNITGKLPAGIMFTNGLLFGTPTESGTFNLAITAIDPNGCVNNQQYVFNVRQVSGDFTLNVSPASQSTPAGSSTSFNIDLQGSTNFSQPVTISASSSPNVGISISPVSATITPGNRISFTVNTSNNTPLATYPVTFTGTVGSVSRSQMAVLEVTSNAPDFTISLTPSNMNLMAGMSTDFVAKIQPIRNFAAPVTFQASISPSTSDLTISPQSTTITPNAMASFTIKASNIASGMFTLNLTATSGQIVRTAKSTINVLLPDFQVIFNQAVTVTRGQTAQITANIVRSGGFTGNVTISPDPNQLKALKIKVNPASQTTSANSVNFDFKVKTKAPAGRQQLSFTGRDDQGNIRTGTLTLIIQ